MSSKRSASSNSSPVPTKVTVVENINTQPTATDKKSVNQSATNSDSLSNKNAIVATQPMKIVEKSATPSTLNKVQNNESQLGSVGNIPKIYPANASKTDSESEPFYHTEFQESQDPFAYDDDDDNDTVQVTIAF